MTLNLIGWNSKIGWNNGLGVESAPDRCCILLRLSCCMMDETSVLVMKICISQLQGLGDRM